MDKISSNPTPTADAQSGVPSEAVSDGLNSPPDDNSTSILSQGARSTHDPAQGQAGPSPEAPSERASTAEAPQPPPPGSDSPAGSSGSYHGGFKTLSLDPSFASMDPSFADENDAMGAGFGEPAPEPTDMIQEIQRGNHINGNTYYLFILYGGRKILLCGDQLADGLKLLQRILAVRGFILGTEDKRDLRERLQGVPLEVKFVVLDRAGWYENVYIQVIRNLEYFIETKIYGKTSVPVYLKPMRHDKPVKSVT